jgi:hypothetical protein
MPQEAAVARRGIYNVEYFSGAQVSLYIGDVWVDEVTTLSYGYQQSRTPVYGYSSTLYDDLTEGRILVSGQFTVNFKEAGYLFLVLDRYRKQNQPSGSLVEESLNSFVNSGLARRENIEQVEQLLGGEISVARRNQYLQDIAKAVRSGKSLKSNTRDRVRSATANSLGGFAETTRRIAGAQSPTKRKDLGTAEALFEKFEDRVWGPAAGLDDDSLHRRADDVRLNPFEIYVAFGDFAGDNTANHTIERLRNVSILGKSKSIQIDGMPIQEQYTFVARNLV